MDEKALKHHALSIRKNIINMVTAAQSGHIGGSLSAVEILSMLYFEIMDINDENFKGIQRDRFILSKGHASPLLYATLYEKGLLKDDLSTFRKINSNLQGHPNMRYVDAIDMSTGSLGQGLSAGVGMALANKIDKNKHRIYVLLGDGECEEGEVWEACMAAAHYKLDNLCVILDYNGLQIDDRLENIISPAPFDEKFMAFKWNVIEINGHSYNDLRSSFHNAQECKTKPTIIIAKTIKGKGVSFMENECMWHGMAPTKEQCMQAITELDGGIDE